MLGQGAAGLCPGEGGGDTRQMELTDGSQAWHVAILEVGESSQLVALEFSRKECLSCLRGSWRCNRRVVITQKNRGMNCMHTTPSSFIIHNYF